MDKYIIINGFITIFSQIICNEYDYCLNKIKIQNHIVNNNNITIDGYDIHIDKIIYITNKYKKLYGNNNINTKYEINIIRRINIFYDSKNKNVSMSCYNKKCKYDDYICKINDNEYIFWDVLNFDTVINSSNIIYECDDNIRDFNKVGLMSKYLIPSIIILIILILIILLLRFIYIKKIFHIYESVR
ncbi:predicted surface unit envelope glycoprotein [Betaentomopoxvirus amoorei]|uniref:AMVITR12 n=1 Tax=Amsacta moorei entomopoxvirus TaxID=28321 RepID=Q9DH73_AMEPV|nr:hypothetical protein AMVITR12a [Amsacta moorei entomopoxvirus]NP_065050.1 predicted surface unit envelope glycoprotein [Amsacta moorei entomopoxvirus]AAG02984.1 AMVITR12 [Amsacta moorei entomopoxvirus]AAG02991.1 AMVITR12 [Amsacta moorei entomopoxvirus]